MKLKDIRFEIFWKKLYLKMWWSGKTRPMRLRWRRWKYRNRPYIEPKITERNNANAPRGGTLSGIDEAWAIADKYEPIYDQDGIRIGFRIPGKEI